MNKITPVPAVNAIIFNKDRKVLLTRRAPHLREPGKWCLPGGHLDGGEDWLTALRREVCEEVGLKVIRERLIGIYSDPGLTVTQASGSESRTQFVVAAFWVLEYSGEVTPNEEVDLWEWFDVRDLPVPIVRSHPIRVQDAFQFSGEVFVR